MGAPICGSPSGREHLSAGYPLSGSPSPQDRSLLLRLQRECPDLTACPCDRLAAIGCVGWAGGYTKLRRHPQGGRGSAGSAGLGSESPLCELDTRTHGQACTTFTDEDGSGGCSSGTGGAGVRGARGGGAGEGSRDRGCCQGLGGVRGRGTRDGGAVRRGGARGRPGLCGPGPTACTGLHI